MRSKRLQKPDAAPVKVKWATPLAHAAYSVEPCPQCGFPEADGGYCHECGFTFRSTVIDRRGKSRV